MQENTKLLSQLAILPKQIGGEAIFQNSKLYRDDEYGHEIKSWFGEKTMINLYKILKCSNLTWTPKGKIGKAMDFSVKTYDCEIMDFQTKQNDEKQMPLNCGPGRKHWLGEQII